MRNRRCAFAVAGAMMMVAGVAQAEMLNIENAGFEDLVLADGAWEIGNIPGWTITGDHNSGTFNPTTVNFLNEAPEGNNTAYINGGSIAQELDYTLQANTQYTIAGLVGNRNWIALADHSIELWAGDTLIASAAGTPAAGEFETLSKMFDAVGNTSPLIGETLRIVLHGESGQGQINFDNITVETTLIPAPGALALLGLAGLAGRRRRRN